MASGDHRSKSRHKPKNPGILLRKAVDLLEHPITKHEDGRQLDKIKDLIDSTVYGFLIPDLPYLIRLFEAIANKIHENDDFREPLEALLKFATVPPMLTRASDKISYARDFQEYFSMLGYLTICLQDESLILMVLEVILTLLQRKLPTGYYCIPLEYCKSAAIESRLPEIVTQLLEVAEAKLYPKLLEVTVELTAISRNICKTMAEHNAIQYILHRLEGHWYERRYSAKPKSPKPTDIILNLDVSTLILWRLLDAIDSQNSTVKSPTVFALWNLQYALRWSIITPNNKINRNNLAALILKLLQLFPKLEIVESGLADDMAIILVSDQNSRVEAKVDNDDFILKKIALACLLFYPQHDTAKILADNQVVSYLVPLITEKQSRWHQEQYCELLLWVLKIIPKLIPIARAEFKETDGLIRMIRVIERYLTDVFDFNILLGYLHCLVEIMMYEMEGLFNSFIEQNSTFNIILRVCSKILRNKALTLLHQNCLSNAFCVLQRMIKPRIVNSAAINLCILYFHRVTKPNPDDFISDPRTALCALHFLWSGIHNNDELSSEFLQKGGMYLLLDMAAMCSFPAKVLALGVLADMCEKSTCVPFLITWRKRGKTILPMLLEIFRGQTEANCCNFDRIGFLPSKDENQWLSLCVDKSINIKTLRSELLMYSRPKIQAIVFALKERFKDRVKLTNNYYQLFDEKLSTDDELTMLFVVNYFPLKMCEAWLNVAKDIKDEEICLTGEDEEQLLDRVHIIRQWKLYLQSVVDNIIKNEKETDTLNEMEDYNSLKESRLSDALDALNDLRFITNCTERMFQMRKKIRLSIEIENRDSLVNYHRTISDLPFTNIYDQEIDIQSNVIISNVEEELIDPVSSEDTLTTELADSERDILSSKDNLSC